PLNRLEQLANHSHPGHFIQGGAAVGMCDDLSQRVGSQTMRVFRLECGPHSSSSYVESQLPDQLVTFAQMVKEEGSFQRRYGERIPRTLPAVEERLHG